MTSPVVGIDLGTTNTVVGVVRDGHAAALADETGSKLLPSVVSFHPNGNVLVGRSAKERRLMDARNTIYSIKRLIGRSWDSDELRTARARFPFEMREGPGQAALVVARGETYTLPEISAFVLRKAKSLAEAALGTPIERAVVTVPANFNDLQRAATKVAGRVAGLEILRILNEPTAAALAYGYGRNSNERLAVYDFGGGTFDVTLLDLADNVFEVLATAGNTFLGGDDIDIAIAERMAQDFLAQHRYDPRADAQVFERLRAAAEAVKVRLSSETSVVLELPDIAYGPNGKPLGLRFAMSQSELERLAAPIVDRTFDVCREALSIARLSPTDFDQVLLVGGSTRIPLVRRRVEDFFQRPVLGHISPDEVVAIGAAIQASALSGAERRRTDVPLPPRAPARTAIIAPASDSRKPPPLPRRTGTGTAVVLTAKGIQPGQEQPHAVSPFVVPPPQGMPSRPAPNTADQVRRKKQTTGVGLGTPPSPTAPMMTAESPETTPGLGRGRLKTGSGLGPIEPMRPVPPARAPSMPPLFQTSTATLQSADDAAAEAQRLAQAHLPLVGTLDEPTLKKARDELTGAPPPADTAELDERPSSSGRISQRYAPSLPLANEEQAALETEVNLPVPDVPSVYPEPPSYGSMRAAPAAAPLEYTPGERLAAPLLIDVTPLTLSVETVSGYCDTIIERNTAVPCQRTRPFVTAHDNQTHVRVRISQGESSRFSQNTLLGELELSGLPPGPRGAVTISVSFALDTDGILNVSAADAATGRATSARVRLVGLPDAGQVTGMISRQQAHPIH